MKAAVYSEYGPPEVLRVEDVPQPEPKEDEILIRVRAAEVTKADCELRAFHFPVKWFALPLRIALGVRRPKRPILGGYFAGVVEARGSAACRFEVGDDVFGAAQLRMGGHAEYVALPERFTIAKKPPNVSFEEAAVVPLGGLNALHFMRLANVKPDDRVLINGAGGSIGTFGAQIAKSMGAHVTAVDATHKAQMLAGIGVDRFIDYTAEDFSNDGATYDVVFDIVAASDYAKCIGVLKPGGRYLTANPTLSKMLRSTVSSRFSDKAARFAFASETLEELNTLGAMLAAGTIRPAIDEVFPLERVADAHRRVETEQRVGVVVLSLS